VVLAFYKSGYAWKRQMASRMGVPATSMRLKSRVPRPACSASSSVLSQLTNGTAPRRAGRNQPTSPTHLPVASDHRPSSILFTKLQVLLSDYQSGQKE